ncbi:hypothetical protein, partial [Sphingomonas sp. S-NIH.Pt15_0812]|uniref:hypothetical protein n=1 Tax=Sphingomonas sp. S-NIH.Pt15_0812 TaxID=1920129 RepID=UPI0019D0C416
HASLVLTQHAYDLILGKTASPHRSSPSDELTYQWHVFRGARQNRFLIRPGMPKMSVNNGSKRSISSKISLTSHPINGRLLISLRLQALSQT